MKNMQNELLKKALQDKSNAPNTVIPEEYEQFEKIQIPEF